MMLSFDDAISKVLPSITRATVPTISAASAVIGISIARQQTRTVVPVRLRFKVGSNPTFFRRARGRSGVQSDLAGRSAQAFSIGFLDRRRSVSQAFPLSQSQCIAPA